MTKIFVSALVLQLVAEGLLDLDGDAAPFAEGITIPASLLNHTSGLQDWVGDIFLDELQLSRALPLLARHFELHLALSDVFQRRGHGRWEAPHVGQTDPLITACEAALTVNVWAMIRSSPMSSKP